MPSTLGTLIDLQPLAFLPKRLSTSIDDTFAAFVPCRLAQIIHIAVDPRRLEEILRDMK